MMTDEVTPEVIKRTQDLLSKYFKSPPLTEKLLRKPPFRFLHDIISAVIKETGFLQGLFSEEELNSDNVKDKESKVAYLTKLIEVVKLATGDSLTARPNKIVAGLEPAKTNELLQSIGKALDEKIDSKQAIEQYVKKKSKSKSDKGESKKSSKKSSTQDKPTENGSSVERKSAISERRKSSENVKVENSNQEKEKVTENIVKEKPEKPSSSKLKKVQSSKTEPENVTRNNSKPVGRKSIVEVPDSIRKLKSSSKDSASTKKRKPLVAQSSDSTQETESLEKKQASEGSNEAEISKNVANGERNEKENVTNKTEIKKEGSVEDVKEPVVKKTEETAGEKVTDSVETFKPVELSSSNEIVKPKPFVRPPSARPPSARPAAPKMKTKTDFIINEEIISSAGNVNVIVESFDPKEDNADDMVVMEAPQDPMKLQDFDKIDSQFSQEHGHLVAQILETQKELINTEGADVLPKKVEIEWEPGLKRDRESTVKEIDKMRSTIQTLTRTTNPLRKLLDFVQEDVEIMQKELQDWQSQYEKYSKELEVEQTKTEESIEPMKESLEELKSHIKTQLSKIGQVKLNIMKNDQKIQRLLNGNF